MAAPVTTSERGITVDFTDANPTLWLPGSGDALPLGLECWFEYNGLQLHRRKDDLGRRILNHYRVQQIDGLQDADVVEVGTEKRPDDDGEDEGSSSYGGRTLVITGEIMPSNILSLRDMQTALRRAFGPIATRPFILRTGDPNTDIMLLARKTGRIEGIEVQTGYNPGRDFQITMRCGNPRIMSLQPQVVRIPAGVAGQVTVVNKGDRSAQVLLQVRGRIDAMNLTNLGNGHRVAFKARVPSGELYTYDPVDGLLETQDGQNRFGAYDSSLSTSKFELAPGNNLLSISMSSADSTAYVDLHFNHTFW